MLCAPVCAVLLRYLGGFGGGLGVIPPRRSCALCGGCGGVLGGQSVQYAAAVFGGDGLLHKGLELLLGQRDGAGQQLLDKPHALAEAVRPVLALLLFLLLDQPLFLICNGTKSKISHSPLTTSLESHSPRIFGTVRTLTSR